MFLLVEVDNYEFGDGWRVSCDEHNLQSNYKAIVGFANGSGSLKYLCLMKMVLCFCINGREQIMDGRSIPNTRFRSDVCGSWTLFRVVYQVNAITGTRIENLASSGL